MTRSVFHSLQTRFSDARLLAATLAGLALASCQPAPPPPSAQEATPQPTELEQSKVKLSDAQTDLAVKDDEIVKAKAALEAARTEVAEKQAILAKRETLVATLQTEIDKLKKREALVFEEISALQKKGELVNALNRYQQFLKDYPTSPLAIHANSAIAEITAFNSRENPPKPDLRDPKVRTREFVQQFEEGYLTLQELAPVLKKRTVSQVLALLGPPNRIFGDGSEIGYVEKAIDPVTSKRGMFIIAFESGVVANLRVEYAGRRVIP